MPIANWKSQPYGCVQSLLFNNPHRVVRYLVRDEQGGWQDRGQRPAPVRRLFETEAPPERTCLQTVQFVHHMAIPPGGRHVAELHIHPDAEELVVILRGKGTFYLDGQPHEVGAEDVVYIPPGADHELRNNGDEMLFCLFINIPAGEGLKRLARGPGKGLKYTEVTRVFPVGRIDNPSYRKNSKPGRIIKAHGLRDSWARIRTGFTYP